MTGIAGGGPSQNWKTSRLSPGFPGFENALLGVATLRDVVRNIDDYDTCQSRHPTTK